MDIWQCFERRRDQEVTGSHRFGGPVIYNCLFMVKPKVVSNPAHCKCFQTPSASLTWFWYCDQLLPRESCVQAFYHHAQVAQFEIQHAAFHGHLFQCEAQQDPPQVPELQLDIT